MEEKAHKSHNVDLGLSTFLSFSQTLLQGASTGGWAMALLSGFRAVTALTCGDSLLPPPVESPHHSVLDLRGCLFT